MLPAFESLEPRLLLDAAPDIRLSTLPGDPNVNDQWAIPVISLDRAWDITTGSEDVVVAVLDTGIDYDHPGLVGKIWTNPLEIPGDGLDNDGNGFIDDMRGWDFVGNDNDATDGHGHGTHVSGIIASAGNIKILPLKTLDDSGRGYAGTAARALDYVTMLVRDHGVNIVAVNASWGSQSVNSVLYDAIAAAGEQDILFVAAAGNTNTTPDLDKANLHLDHYPSSYDLDNILAVAASDQDDARPVWASWGLQSVDIAAPGVNILSTIPGGGYMTMSGSSMATPFVAGAAALMASLDPSATAARLKNDIMLTADPVDWTSIWGEYETASQGRLNVRAALDALGQAEVLFEAPHVIDVDNHDATTAGAWRLSRQVPQYYGTDYLDDWGAGDGWAEFRVQPDATGTWEVWMSYAGGTVIDVDGSRYTYADNVPVTVTWGGGEETFYVNEGPNSAQWKFLREIDLVEGETVTLLVESQGVTSGHVCADAFRLIYFPDNQVVPVVEDVIVDDPQATKVGVWRSSGAVDAYNGSCVYGDTIGPTISWSAQLNHAVYDVYAFIPGLRSDGTHYIRDYDADYTIEHADGSTSIAFNQNDYIGQWAPLGQHTFDSTGTITLFSDTYWKTTVGRPVADAVKFVWVEDVVVPTPPPPPVEPVDVIVDNTDAGFTTQGLWRASGATDAYGGSCVYGDSIGPTATWSYDLPRPGDFEILVFIPGVRANGTHYIRDYDADYTIFTADGPVEVSIDQNQYIGQWASLGTYQFDAQAKLTLLSDTDWRYTLGRPVADAVRFLEIV